MFDHGFPTDWSTIKKLIWLVGTGIVGGVTEIWKTVTGTLIHITDALASPVQALSVAIEPQQSGSGDPSPTNVRPITGWTGCNIRHTGSNICGGEWLKQRLVFAMPTGTLDETNKTFTFTSQASESYWVYSYANYPFKENTQYTFIITCSKNSGSSTNLRVVYTDGTRTNFVGISASKTMNVFVSAAGKTVDHFMKYTGSGTTTLYYEESGIFEGVLTASDFEPYVGTVYPISWETEAGTVYGGTLDAVNGELTSTKGKIVLNGNETETWIAVGEAFYMQALPEGYSLDSQDDWICNKYKPTTKIPKSAQIADRDNLTVFNQNKYEERIFIKDTSITTVADLRTSLVSAPVEIVFTLPTSSEHTVTPVSVSTLAGENNIWADVNGEITLTYKSDSGDSDKADIGKADFMKLLS